MGKNERKDVNTQAKANTTQANQQYDNVDTQLQNRINQVQPQSDSERSQLWDQYTNASQTGLVDPTALAGLNATLGKSAVGTSSGGGGAAGQSLNDPSRDYMQTFGDINKTGGDFASYGGYQNFANTGGFSDADKTNFLNYSTAGVPAMFAAAKRQAERSGVLQGGANTGLAASLLSGSRKAGIDASAANLAAQTGLNTQVNANKLSGLGGMENIEATQTSNKMAAANQLMQAAQAAQAQANAAAAAGNQSAALALQQRAQDLAAQEFIISSTQSGQLAGLGGLSSLYSGAGSGELNGLYSTMLGSIGQQGQQLNNTLGTQANNAAVPGWGSSLANSLLGAGAGVAGALINPASSATTAAKKAAATAQE